MELPLVEKRRELAKATASCESPAVVLQAPMSAQVAHRKCRRALGTAPLIKRQATPLSGPWGAAGVGCELYSLQRAASQRFE